MRSRCGRSCSRVGDGSPGRRSFNGRLRLRPGVGSAGEPVSPVRRRRWLVPRGMLRYGPGGLAHPGPAENKQETPPRFARGMIRCAALCQGAGVRDGSSRWTVTSSASSFLPDGLNTGCQRPPRKTRTPTTDAAVAPRTRIASSIAGDRPGRQRQRLCSRPLGMPTSRLRETP